MKRSSVLVPLVLILLTAFGIASSGFAQLCGTPTASAELTSTSCGNHGNLVVHWSFPGAVPTSLFVDRTKVHIEFFDMFGNKVGETDTGPSIGDDRLPEGQVEFPPSRWIGGPGFSVKLTASQRCGLSGSRVTVTGPTTTFVVPNYDSVCPPPPPPPPPPKPTVTRFQFAYNSNQPDERVLLHKYDTGDTSGPLGNGLFSSYQVANHFLPPTVFMDGAVTTDGQSDVRSVYFRVLDPQDSAPYAPSVGGNDNLDTALPKGKLYCVDPTGKRIDAVNGILETLSNHDNVAGRIRLFLETSSNVSGENYQVEASFEPTFSCATAGPGGTNTCPQSVRFVTWKRVYVEIDRMFRHGSYISRRAAPAAVDVFVDDISKFGSVGSTVTVRFVHAPPSEPTSVPDTFYSEDHTVQLVARQVAADGTVTDAHLHILDPGGLKSAYDTDPMSRASKTVAPFLRDGAGVVTGLDTADFFTPGYGSTGSNGKTPVEEVFAAAYVELRVAAQDVREIPFAPRWPLDYENLPRVLADKWLQNAISVSGDPLRLSLPNRMHLLGGNMEYLQENHGLTTSTAGGNFSWVYVGRIEQNTSGFNGLLRGLDPVKVTYENVAHELIHQWRVNLSNAGHCAENAYTADGTYCRMHEAWDAADARFASHNAERGDGKIDLHYKTTGAGVDSEYVTIRRQTEPVPTN